MSVRWSRTMLIRFVAPLGTYKLVVVPAPTLKVWKELNALALVTVAVVTLVTVPTVVTVVAVRPSGLIACARARAGKQRTSSPRKNASAPLARQTAPTRSRGLAPNASLHRAVLAA